MGQLQRVSPGLAAGRSPARKLSPPLALGPSSRPMGANRAFCAASCLLSVRKRCSLTSEGPGPDHAAETRSLAPPAEPRTARCDHSRAKTRPRGRGPARQIGSERLIMPDACQASRPRGVLPGHGVVALSLGREKVLGGRTTQAAPERMIGARAVQDRRLQPWRPESAI